MAVVVTQEPKSYHEMVADFLREAGVLIVVFGPLEEMIGA